MSNVNKENVFTILSLFRIAKKVNEKIDKDVKVDEKKRDTVILNTIIETVNK